MDVPEDNIEFLSDQAGIRMQDYSAAQLEELCTHKYCFYQCVKRLIFNFNTYWSNIMEITIKIDESVLKASLSSGICKGMIWIVLSSPFWGYLADLFG